VAGPPGFEPGAYGLKARRELDELRNRAEELKEVAILRKYVTPGNLEEFYSWATRERGINERTAKLYVQQVQKPFEKKRNRIFAYRAYARFLIEKGIGVSDILEKLKTISSKPDLRVPTLEEVRKTLQLAKEYSENVYFVYRMALESGSRLSEILKVLKEPEKDVCDNDICYYPLAWTRGQKSVFYVFHLTPLRKVNITMWAISDFERRRDALAIKYFRKFVATKMAELSIPLDIIDFIQGRKPTRVLTQHYVSLFGIAKEQYKKYAEWLAKYAF
jgi:intergrase/recombinase